MNKSEIYMEIKTEEEKLRAIEILEKAGESVFPRCSLKEKNNFGKLTMYHDGEWDGLIEVK
jgi:predicted GNAT family acetyltransferase